MLKVLTNSLQYIRNCINPWLQYCIQLVQASNLAIRTTFNFMKKALLPLTLLLAVCTTVTTVTA